MKAIKINGEIKTFSKLPSTWKDDNGTYLNFDKLTDIEATKYGFYDIVKPEYNSKIEKLSPIYFSGEFFTYNVSAIEFTETLEELKDQKINKIKRNANSKLSESDWYIVRFSENGRALPKEILDERQAIRHESNVKEAAILALQTKQEVVAYE